MCDQCLPSRRQLLKLSALGAAAATIVPACQSTPAISDLPEVYEDHLSAGNGPKAVSIDPKSIVLPPPQPAQRSDYGDIMPRSAWSRYSLTLRDATPINGIKRITIHHSGDGKPFLGESVADVARHLQVVQQAHLQRGMIDIAYHFAVDRTGRLWQLRWLAYEGQHVRIGRNGVRNNEHNVGIVVLGDFNLQYPTPVQRDRLFSLARLVRSKYQLVPSSVVMHGELVSTDCPGRRLIPLILDGRRRGLL
jgi:hypothetical protein